MSSVCLTATYRIAGTIKDTAAFRWLQDFEAGEYQAYKDAFDSSVG